MANDEQPTPPPQPESKPNAKPTTPKKPTPATSLRIDQFFNDVVPQMEGVRIPEQVKSVVKAHVRKEAGKVNTVKTYEDTLKKYLGRQVGDRSKTTIERHAKNRRRANKPKDTK